MEPYNAEFRGEVLAACDANEGTRAVAVRFKVADSWVRQIKQQRRETGQIAPKKAAPRKPKSHAWADWLMAIEHYQLPDAFACSLSRTHELAKTPTRLRRMDVNRQERLINWGYAVCDAALRKHFDFSLARPKTLPYPATSI